MVRFFFFNDMNEWTSYAQHVRIRIYESIYCSWMLNSFGWNPQNTIECKFGNEWRCQLCDSFFFLSASVLRTQFLQRHDALNAPTVLLSSDDVVWNGEYLKETFGHRQFWTVAIADHTYVTLRGIWLFLKIQPDGLCATIATSPTLISMLLLFFRLFVPWGNCIPAPVSNEQNALEIWKIIEKMWSGQGNFSNE